MAESLLSWQWNLYAGNHCDRRNLLIHILSVPFFQAGTLMLACSPVMGWVFAPAGLGTMAVVMIMQGRGHKLEKEPPVPFRGPLDVVGRILLEQWINFPRFVLSGGWAKAWATAPTTT
jgi:Protein of unknown function (DUF962)